MSTNTYWVETYTASKHTYVMCSILFFQNERQLRNKSTILNCKRTNEDEI